MTPDELGRALLDACGGNQSQAAEVLGTSRAQLVRLLSGADCRWSTLQRVTEELGKARGRRLRVRLVLEEE
jgi:predicted transcriptional regulator